MGKNFIFAFAILATLTVSAKMPDANRYESSEDTDRTEVCTQNDNAVSNIAERMQDNQNTNIETVGTTTIDGVTYTKAVGGTIADYVDLGIKDPNGRAILWATHNLGASSPEEYGAYIAWGENCTKEEGYTAGIKPAGYRWRTLRFCKGSSGAFDKYIATKGYGAEDSKGIIESEDDAATVNWGKEWRTPTDAEMTALRTSCTWKWYQSGNRKYNGVAGYKVTGPNGNSIFLPAAGWRINKIKYFEGSFGFYWSSSLDTSHSNNATELGFGCDHVGRFSDYRFNGQSLRPVRCEE